MIHRARTPATLLALVVAALLTGACDVSMGEGGFNMSLASGRASDEWSKSFPVEPGAKLLVKNVNGSVTVQAAPGATAIEVKAERIARASTDEAARELLKKIEIAAEATAGNVSIQTKAPKTSGRDGHEVKYTISVPESVAVVAETVNGPVRLKGLTGEAVARTVNGGIDGEGLAGHVEAMTTNGGVDVKLASLGTGGVRLETVNGGIHLALPKDAKADISARVVNGGLDADQLPIEKTGDSTRRRLEGKLNGGGSRVELSTTNGGIHLTSR